MLKEMLGVVEKTDTYPLLVSFTALSLACVYKSGELLRDPYSIDVAVIIPAVLCGYILIWGWKQLIRSMDSRLSSSDIVHHGPIVGCAILSCCLLVTFSYLSSHSEGLSFSLLGDRRLIWILNMYLLAAETIKIKRYDIS